MKGCPVCGDEIIGRADKKYCSAKCKSAHQYEMRLTKESFYLEVDKQLKLNRKLLKRYNLSGYTTLRKEVLLNGGFNPRYFTHYWKNSKNQVYLFCYDYGFLELKENENIKYLIVTWQNYMR